MRARNIHLTRNAPKPAIPIEIANYYTRSPGWLRTELVVSAVLTEKFVDPPSAIEAAL